jgi:hypothetical protein
MFKCHATDNVLRLAGEESVIKAANAQDIPDRQRYINCEY